MLFPDDNLIFCHAPFEDCGTLEEIFFLPYLMASVWLEIKNLFGITEVSTFDRFLDLYAMVGRQRRAFPNEL